MKYDTLFIKNGVSEYQRLEGPQHGYTVCGLASEWRHGELKIEPFRLPLDEETDIHTLLHGTDSAARCYQKTMLNDLWATGCEVTLSPFQSYPEDISVAVVPNNYYTRGCADPKAYTLRYSQKGGIHIQQHKLVYNDSNVLFIGMMPYHKVGVANVLQQKISVLNVSVSALAHCHPDPEAIMDKIVNHWYVENSKSSETLGEIFQNFAAEIGAPGKAQDAVNSIAGYFETERPAFGQLIML